MNGRVGLVLVSVGLTGLIAIMLTWCGATLPTFQEPSSRKAQQATASVTVEQRAVDVSAITIGLVYSSSGEGADWFRSASGTDIAAYRFGLGGTAVTLRTIDDQGTIAGANAAVNTLIGAHVAGIVLASSGAHLKNALEITSAAKVPVLLPYFSLSPDESIPGVWSLAPTDQSVAKALQKAVDEVTLAGVGGPLVIEADGQKLPSVSAAHRITFAGNQALLEAAVSALLKAPKRPITSFCVTGNAATQAAIVATLQGHKTALPIFLTPHALSPVFALDLQKAGGSSATQLMSAGVDIGQASSLAATQAGAQAAAFFQAVSMFALANSQANMDGSGTRRGTSASQGKFAAVADPVSHDTIVALVRAAQHAKSTDPVAVLTALKTLKLGPSDGIVMPSLDFTSAQAIPVTAVVPLVSTENAPLADAPSQRSDESSPELLYWFALPDGHSQPAKVPQ